MPPPIRGGGITMVTKYHDITMLYTTCNIEAEEGLFAIQQQPWHKRQ